MVSLCFATQFHGFIRFILISPMKMAKLGFKKHVKHPKKCGVSGAEEILQAGGVGAP